MKLDPDTLYEICAVCGGAEEVIVGDNATMECPACVDGFYVHECPAED